MSVMNDETRRKILRDGGLDPKKFEDAIQNVDGRKLTDMQRHIEAKEAEQQKQRNDTVLE